MENPIKMDDLGGKTYYFRKHPYIICKETSGIKDMQEAIYLSF